jgi:protease-4
MSTERKGLLRRFFGAIWTIIDWSRRLVANLLFLAIVVLLVGVFLWSHVPVVPDGAALVLAPSGSLVEQNGVDNPLGILESGGGARGETRMHDLLEAIAAAKGDARIAALVIETDGLEGSGMSKLQELRRAIDAFRAAGKPVYAWGQRYDQGQYYLAAAADEVYMAPDGLVLVQGLAHYGTYFKGALDKLGVKVHVFKVGTWKSFTEPYTRTGMSDADRSATQTLLDSAWTAMSSDLSAARELAPDALQRYADGYRTLLEATAGDTAKVALNAGLIDGFRTRDAMRSMLQEKLGASADGEDFRQIDVDTYLDAVHLTRLPKADKVAVVVAQGAIMDGEQPPGVIGGDTLARLIRQVREDDAVKAVVLRVDSPGGSAFASEVIRAELAATRAAGKPVVVSMSSAAASGGYWISMASDEIWANPTTITGSIGIFAMFPEIGEPMARLGLTVDGVRTSRLAGGLDPRRPLEPDVAAALQLTIEHGYRQFLGRVAEGRGMTREAVDAVAQGRVWTGTQALERGLVDALGGLPEAIASAARRAGMEEFEVTYPEPELPARERLLRRLLELVAPPARQTGHASLFGRALAQMEREAAGLLRWNDPANLYAHCLCVAP